MWHPRKAYRASALAGAGPVARTIGAQFAAAGGGSRARGGQDQDRSAESNAGEEG